MQSMQNWVIHQLTVRDTTILDKNLETLWKILLTFVFPLPFALLLEPRNVAITDQHCRGKGTCIGVSWIFGEDCVRCKGPSGYHYTLFRRGGMLEETASVTYSVRCFDFKGFKCMTRISFLVNLYRSKFRELFLDFKEKKLQYQLYSEQGANQEDKGLANITNFQQWTQCSQCRIVQDMISMRTNLNPIVNIF